MPVQRLNHAVLYVRDVERSLAFYRDVLGFRVKIEIPGRAVFLQARGLDQRPRPRPVPDRRRRRAVGGRPPHRRALPPGLGGRHARRAVPHPRGAAAAGALVGASDHATTKALYAQDPDGIEFEVSWLLPADLITAEVPARRAWHRPLDLDAEIERYGAQTRGGVGVSDPRLTVSRGCGAHTRLAAASSARPLRPTGSAPRACLAALEREGERLVTAITPSSRPVQPAADFHAADPVSSYTPVTANLMPATVMTVAPTALPTAAAAGTSMHTLAVGWGKRRARGWSPPAARGGWPRPTGPPMQRRAPPCLSTPPRRGPGRR